MGTYLYIETTAEMSYEMNVLYQRKILWNKIVMKLAVSRVFYEN